MSYDRRVKDAKIRKARKLVLRNNLGILKALAAFDEFARKNAELLRELAKK